MGSSSKIARRRQRAQESLERGASHSGQEKGNNVDSEVEIEGDHEVLFPPRTHDNVGNTITKKSPGSAGLCCGQCDQYGQDIERRDSGSVPGYGPNPTGVSTTAQG